MYEIKEMHKRYSKTLTKELRGMEVKLNRHSKRADPGTSLNGGDEKESGTIVSVGIQTGYEGDTDWLFNVKLDSGKTVTVRYYEIW